MILSAIRSGEGAEAIPVHPRVTVVTGLDPAARAAWVAELGRAVRGEPGTAVVEVTVDGRRQPLTRQVARRLGLHQSTVPVTLVPSDLPGARPVVPPDPEPDPEAEAHEVARAAMASAEAARAGAEAEVAGAEAEVAGAEAEVARAAEALDAVRGELTALVGPAEPGGAAADPAAEVAAATAALEGTRAGAAAAGRRLAEARQLQRAAQEEEAAARAAMAARIDDLNRQQAELVDQRARIVERLHSTPVPGDPAPVEAALAGLRRLRAVQPRESPEALALKQRWTAVRRRLADLGELAEPPEALVAPALAALQQARESLARAEADSRRPPPDAEAVSAAVTAHAELLAAEQKAMRRGTRLNRRRVEQAQEAESKVLAALGLADYGEFLRRFGSPAAGPSASRAVEAARAALADAEAVWEELHQGSLPAEWTAAKEEEAAVRAAAAALLGREVAGDEVEAALEGHRQTVVDAGWAEHELAEALAAAGGAVPDGVDVEEAAGQWLARLPDQRQARSELEQRLADTDSRLRAVGEQLAGHQAETLFAADVAAGAGGSGEGPGAGAGDELLAALEQAHREAEAAESEAGQALVEARRRQEAHERLRQRQAGLEAEAAGAEADAAAARARLAELGGALEDADRRRAEAAEALAARPRPEPPPPPPPPPPGAADLAAVAAVEAELYVLARLVALRGPSPEEALPLVVDAAAVAGLPGDGAERVLGLLERAAAVQLVVLGDDGGVVPWARRLGEGAAVRSASPSREPTRR